MKPISLLPLTIAFSGWAPEAFPEEFALIRANGLQFAFLETGKRGAPLVICLHGFPGDAFSFTELLPALAERGYHAVAPFTRGHYPTEIPASGDYSIETLARDALELIDALGASEAVIIGHDWGAFAGYTAANLAPERVKRLVTLATPHPRLKFPWGKWSFPTDVKLTRPGRAAAALGYNRSFRKDLANLRRLLLYRQKTTVPTLALANADLMAQLEASELATSEVLKFLGPAEKSD